MDLFPDATTTQVSICHPDQYIYATHSMHVVSETIMVIIIRGSHACMRKLQADNVRPSCPRTVSLMWAWEHLHVTPVHMDQPLIMSFHARADLYRELPCSLMDQNSKLLLRPFAMATGFHCLLRTVRVYIDCHTRTSARAAPP